MISLSSSPDGHGKEIDRARNTKHKAIKRKKEWTSSFKNKPSTIIKQDFWSLAFHYDYSHIETDQNFHSDINCPDKQLQIISCTRRRQYLQWTKKFNESERNNMKLIWFPFFSFTNTFSTVFSFMRSLMEQRNVFTSSPPLHCTAACIKAQSSEMDKQKQFWRDNFKNKSVLTLQWINLAPPAVALLLSPAR